MTATAHLAASNEKTPVPQVQRRSLRDAFNAAAAGAPPRQPHSNGDLLIAEAFIAQEKLEQVSKMIRSHLRGSIFEPGPAKDLARAKAKTREKGDLAMNCDFSRARVLLRDVGQIKKAIDIFGEKNNLRLPGANGAVDVAIVDVDNTFSTPSPKKPGLRNLDIKLLIPITLETGEQSYHVCELQFQHQKTKAVYEKSHKIYESARTELGRRQFIENAMEISGCPETARSLEKRWAASTRTYEELMEKRKKLNAGIAEKLGLNELTGYQPCKENRRIFLHCTP